MNKELIAQINQDVDDRQEWASGQELIYRMRNGGVPRSLPFPGASQLWYPLGDSMIEKIKPAYIQQMYGGENIATFVCLRQQDQELTTGISGWFDYMLKQKTNFERAMFVAIDQMLECGFCPVKVYWDAKTKRLRFEQIDPMHLIVPKTTQEYNENGGADRVVHVLHLSVDEYKANALFNQDPMVIKRIKGKGGQDSGQQHKSDTVNVREGINCSANENEIVLWEVYCRDRTAEKITVHTVAPLLPETENEVRAEFVLPYNKGCFANGDHFPFFKLRAEIKGKSYYSARGIVQINAPFEMSLCANWNAIHDHLAFSAQPLFENTGAFPVPQGGNFKTNPGQILPAGLTMARNSQPPSSLREDMDLIRAIAEDRTQIPDLGNSEHLTGNVPATQTATGINAVMAQSSQGTDMRARVFRMDLAVGLSMAWSIYQQYASDQTLQYLAGTDVKQVDQSAFHGEYEIKPNGSSDSWNKSALIAKRTLYYQESKTNPFFDKGETTKWWMEADDPAMIKRLYKDPGAQAASQAEDQAIECLLISAGTIPVVEESDDDKVHLQILVQFGQDKIQRVEMTPEIARGILQHGGEHMQALHMKKDPQAKAIEAQLRPMIEILQHIAMQPGPPPRNVLPMQPDLQQPSGTDQAQTENNNSQAVSPPVAAQPSA